MPGKPQLRLRSAKADALNQAESAELFIACRDLLDNLVVRLPLFAGLRVGDVQEQLKLSRTTVYSLIWQGSLPSVRIGRTIRILASALEQWVAEQQNNEGK